MDSFFWSNYNATHRSEESKKYHEKKTTGGALRELSAFPKRQALPKSDWIIGKEEGTRSERQGAIGK